MNPEILTFLVRGKKISTTDRTEPWLSTHPPIKLPEVAPHLAGTLGHARRFPHEWRGGIESKGRSKNIYRGDLDGWRGIG